LRTIIYWQIVILLFFWAWLAACGPKHSPEYKPASDMYANYLKDKYFCEASADKKSFVLLGEPDRGGPIWVMKYTNCMSEKGWNKTRAFDKGFK
jgi:predicted small lipoprotein YifL